ncbi:MAG: chaperonin [Syntrophomonadaceae bacterium]|nr:chaperonin [Syntrophomonadaceae bacterium]
MSDQVTTGNQSSENKFQTLLNNANAARIISQSVEGTIGPRGLDIMMVDRFGDVVITNDGVTILKLMDINHPAAHMIINTARSQQAEVGDGTTTTTIIAGALIAEGVTQVLKGVPVSRVIEGINLGVKASLTWLWEQARPVDSVQDEALFHIALIAGRGNDDLAKMVTEGAKIIGRDLLLQSDYSFADAITAREGADNQVFEGVILNRQPVNKEMPRQLNEVKILVIDDALAPEEMSHEILKTEAGFQYYMEARQNYEYNLHKICSSGINTVVVNKNIDDIAETIFTDAGVMVLQRVSSHEMEKICQHTTARKIKRQALNREGEDLNKYIGYACQITLDEKLGITTIHKGAGTSLVSVIIGASTEEVVDERERMAKDAAAALQAAVKAGVIPGGGAIEVFLADKLEGLAREQEGMVSYGVLCVREALLKPFTCMADNAGFNSLEKLGDVMAAQRKYGQDFLSFDIDNGRIINTIEEGIIDAALVKIHAIKAAAEVAVAILRIETVIKMRDESAELNRNIIE